MFTRVVSAFVFELSVWNLCEVCEVCEVYCVLRVSACRVIVFGGLM